MTLTATADIGKRRALEWPALLPSAALGPAVPVSNSLIVPTPGERSCFFHRSSVMAFSVDPGAVSVRSGTHILFQQVPCYFGVFCYFHGESHERPRFLRRGGCLLFAGARGFRAGPHAWYTENLWGSLPSAFAPPRRVGRRKISPGLATARHGSFRA